MEPNQVFEGNLGDAIGRLENELEDTAMVALRTTIALMLTFGVAKFDTRMIPEIRNGDVQLRITNGPESQSWSIEIINSAELRGAAQ